MKAKAGREFASMTVREPDAAVETEIAAALATDGWDEVDEDAILSSWNLKDIQREVAQAASMAYNESEGLGDEDFP